MLSSQKYEHEKTQSIIVPIVQQFPIIMPI